MHIESIQKTKRFFKKCKWHKLRQKKERIVRKTEDFSPSFTSQCTSDCNGGVCRPPTQRSEPELQQVTDINEQLVSSNHESSWRSVSTCSWFYSRNVWVFLLCVVGFLFIPKNYETVHVSSLGHKLVLVCLWCNAKVMQLAVQQITFSGE